VEEFGISEKPGAMYKADETGFDVKNEPQMIRGKGGSLLVLSVVKMLQWLDILVPLECTFCHSLY
jgi:hypothetical protein